MKRDSKNGREWVTEFAEFLDGEEATPPRELTERILARVREDLEPSAWTVLMKMAVLHLFAGSLSLLFCSQFGMGRVTALTHAFMSFGDLACMALCGSLFVGMTGVVASVALSASELKAIRAKAYFPIVGLQIASLAVFLLFGAEIAFVLGLAWLLGGLFAGIAVTEAGLWVRHALPRR